MDTMGMSVFYCNDTKEEMKRALQDALSWSAPQRVPPLSVCKPKGKDLSHVVYTSMR